LEVYAPQHESAYLRTYGFPSHVLELRGPRDPIALVDLLTGADLLVLPYNFEAETVRYVRLSMPTKAPAYMMSGTPILVYAPAELATAEYASREGWGYVLSHPDRRGLMDALKTLMGDESLRARLGCRAKEVAARNHDASSVRQAFWDSLCAAARRDPAKSG
jgi:glycosyltransferase involved in cell wall biosynthesis